MENRRQNQEANVTGDVLQDSLILSVDNSSNSWVADSRDLFNSTPHMKHFIYYGQGDFGRVHLGDDVP